MVRRGEGRRFPRCRGVVRATSWSSLPLSCAPRGILPSRSRDAVKEPRFGAEIGLIALQRLLDGSGDDRAVSLVQQAFDHLLHAASRIGARDWAKKPAQCLVDAPALRTGGPCSACSPNP